MEIKIVREWKKNGYTISKAYVDGVFVCNALEPTDRGLVNEAEPGQTGSEAFKKARAATLQEKARHAAGTTAIPYGRYEVTITWSAKFQGYRPLVKDVPGFAGIRFHEGNTPNDTMGCFLFGFNREKGKVLESWKCLCTVMEMMRQAKKRGEKVWLVVTETFI